MKRKNRKRLSVALIGTGLAILLAVGIYEASAYPWHLVLARFGWAEEVEELPDPTALPQELLVTPQPTAPAGGMPSEEGWGPDSLPEAPPVVMTRPKVDLTLIGYIKIPKLKVSEHLIEGVNDEMYYGIGHYPGTAMPGEAGNCVVAGHRNHVLANALRHLDKIGVGDAVEITYGGNVFVYEVVQTLVVNPSDVWVMGSKVLEGKSHVLTIITCTPAHNPTHRLIVHCALVGAPEPEEAPTVDEPIEEPPVMEVPVEELPVVEVPVEETPVEETPAVEAPIEVLVEAPPVVETPETAAAENLPPA